MMSSIQITDPPPPVAYDVRRTCVFIQYTLNIISIRCASDRFQIWKREIDLYIIVNWCRKWSTFHAFYFTSRLHCSVYSFNQAIFIFRIHSSKFMSAHLSIPSTRNINIVNSSSLVLGCFWLSRPKLRHSFPFQSVVTFSRPKRVIIFVVSVFVCVANLDRNKWIMNRKSALILIFSIILSIDAQDLFGE